MTINSQLLARIADLKKLCYDEGDSYSEDSLEDLLSFWKINGFMLRIPSLVVTPEGNFRATWKEDNNTLYIEFLGKEKIKTTIRTTNSFFSFISRIPTEECEFVD